MNKEIKAKWIEALKSGKYKQTKGTLKDEHGYCCLGVLCEIFREETGKGEFVPTLKNSNNKRFQADDIIEEGVPPSPVIKWAEMENNNPSITLDEKPKLLAVANDNGSTFLELADIIEQQL